MRIEHYDDIAELYALGLLDDSERILVDRHLRGCPACAQVVSSAEHDVALVASHEPLTSAPPDLDRRIERLFHRRSFSASFPAAIAAALLIGLLPSTFFWSQSQRMHTAMLAQSAAMERIVSQPHRMATFQSMPPAASAQVAYAPNGSWYVVMVRGIHKPLSIAWMHEGERTLLGDAVPLGNLAILYLPKSHRMDRLALMDGDRIVAAASLSWGKAPPDRQAARSS